MFSRFRLRRSSPTVAILVLTVALAGVLTYEAWDAARSHRAMAEGALRDYAAFAAWEFSLSAKEELYQMLVSIFSPVMHEDPIAPGVPLAPPSILARPLAQRVQCPDDPRYYFRIDIPQKTMLISGTPPSSEMQRWIRDTVLADVKRYGTDWSYSSVAGELSSGACTIVYQVKWSHDMHPAAAYGFRLCLTRSSAPDFAHTMESARLLPPSLTHDIPNDTMMSVILRDGSGRELWRTAHQFEPLYVGEASVPYFGGLVTQVTLNPRFSSSLVIGGLPHSRLPLLLGVLALTIGLALAGVLQLRREDELVRLRGDFIASVSHELRTPLAQLRMFAETLLLGRVRSEQEGRRSLEIVDQEARRLSHLVENILQFSRAERHSIRLSPTVVPLAPQITAALETFEPIAHAKQVCVITSLDESIRCSVDSGALRQILLNLLDNAIKYGPVGQQVRVVLERSRDERCARVVVEDQGPGIPRDRRERVWEPFYRLDRDAGSAVAGSGIGLSVVRELVSRHGGKVAIEDAMPGARVIVELPRCESTVGASV
ncbi:MAG: HAMP domain-containing sensor histidine kinase [bacterium]